MLAVTGRRSLIIEEMLLLIPPNEVIAAHTADDIPTTADRYVFAAGVLSGKQVKDQSLEEIGATFRVNFQSVADACDRILSSNGRARICVVGSESGFAGSFDGTYAASKAELHRYVERKRLPALGQQLVCVAPSIIEDAGMTIRRTDLVNLEQRRQAHPKKRFLRAAEIARLIHFLLYVDDGYITGTVVRMNGGQHTA